MSFHGIFRWIHLVWSSQIHNNDWYDISGCWANPRDSRWSATACGLCRTCAVARTRRPTSPWCRRVCRCWRGCCSTTTPTCWRTRAGRSRTCLTDPTTRSRRWSMPVSAGAWSNCSCTLHRQWCKARSVPSAISSPGMTSRRRYGHFTKFNVVFLRSTSRFIQALFHCDGKEVYIYMSRRDFAQESTFHLLQLNTN